MTDCLPILFNYSPPASFQALIIPLPIQPQLSQFCSLDQYADSESRSALTLQSRDKQPCQITRPELTDPLDGKKAFALLVVDDFHVAVLLNPKLAHDDIVHAACGVCPGVGLVVPMEPKVKGQPGIKEQVRSRLERHLLGQLQRDHTPGLGFYTLPPEFEFGVNGAVEHKVLLEALSLEGTDGGVMADLLRHPPEAQILPAIGDKFDSTVKSR